MLNYWRLVDYSICLFCLASFKDGKTWPTKQLQSNDIQGLPWTLSGYGSTLNTAKGGKSIIRSVLVWIEHPNLIRSRFHFKRVLLYTPRMTKTIKPPGVRWISQNRPDVEIMFPGIPFGSTHGTTDMTPGLGGQRSDSDGRGTGEGCLGAVPFGAARWKRSVRFGRRWFVVNNGKEWLIMDDNR